MGNYDVIMALCATLQMKVWLGQCTHNTGSSGCDMEMLSHFPNGY